MARLCAGVKRAIAAALCAVWLAGCATSALDMAPERPDRPWAPATTGSGEIIAGAPPGQPTAEGYVLPANPALGQVRSPPTVDTARTYSLSELIDLAESSNPATRIAWNDARRAALAAGIAESTFLPSITATAIGGYQGNSGHQTGLGTSFKQRQFAEWHGLGSIPAMAAVRLWPARRRGGRGEAGIGDFKHHVHRRASAAYLQCRPRLL